MTRTGILVFLLALLGCPWCAAAPPDERPISFRGANNATLAGTLQLPEARGDAAGPALVLLSGSGPTDRNGNQPPTLITDLHKQIAQALAARGIASLRFDKRGMAANAAELPKDRGLFAGFFSWENFVGDAAAACRFLRQQPGIDPARVGILGHSEGGLLALEAARALKAEGHEPAALILISTPGRPIDLVIVDQLKSLLLRQQATAQQTEYFLGENTRIIRAIRETGRVPWDVPAGLAALYPSYLGPFLRSELAVDPCKLAAAFPGPVLVIAGAADTQVSPDRDAKALAAALATRQGDVHTLAIIPQASHNLKLLATDADPGLAGPVAPAALDQLQQWAASHLSRP